MEEKQRYEYFFGTNTVKDNINKEFLSYKRVIDTLNQQDKQIKELEEENKELEIKLDKCGTELVNAESLVSYLENENKQLKQQLHDLPNKIVGEIRDVAGEYWDFFNICKECGTLTTEDFDEILDTILKNFGGENE